MEFDFDERKAAQAAAQLLALRGGKLNAMVLLKELYLADRKSLVERGMPITGDRMFSMPHGPVLSHVYDLMKMKADDAKGVHPWFDYISERSDYDVLLVSRPERDELSDYELGILAAIDAAYGGKRFWEMREITHSVCPEWQEPKGSSIPIEPETILSKENIPPEEIEDMRQEAAAAHFLRFLSSAAR